MQKKRAATAPALQMLTLRQIEIIRAIMVTGTVAGASRLLNVSSPGISRAMKHAEASIGGVTGTARQRKPMGESPLTSRPSREAS